MPFTPAHILAVLPGVHARRLRLDPTCLVIGSMGPDLEYFLRGSLVGRSWHVLPGLVAYAMPVTLAFAVVWHAIVKWPALLAAPRAFTRLGAFAEPWRARWTAGAVVSVLASTVLGNLTHVVWDGATHSDDFIVKRFPVLARPVFDDVVLHRVLQHASTLVGLAGVTAYVLWRLRRVPSAGSAGTATADAPRGRARLAFALCIAAGIAAAELRLPAMLRATLGHQVVAAISGALAGAIVAGLVLFRAGRRYRSLAVPGVT